MLAVICLVSLQSPEPIWRYQSLSFGQDAKIGAAALD